MTAQVRGTQHAAAIAASQASQNTAPVAEFRCLFTHDVRRKQKRWQDGFLKFHTFNNRVMVYDQARNFLGDTYHKDSNELFEGDELNLDKGIMVEVSEAIGVTQTDLTALLEKKPREPPPRPSAASQPRPFQRPSLVAPPKPQHSDSQLKHRSLNTLLGTPKGPIGKAQPIKSPYEARKEKENEVVEERATKRQKLAQKVLIRRASSPAQELSPIAKKVVPPVAVVNDTRPLRKPTKFIPPTATIITIDSEPETLPALNSDITLPDTPLRARKARIPSPASIAPQTVLVPTSSPPPIVRTPQVLKTSREKVPVPHVKAQQTRQRPAPPSSPPVSASNHLSNIDVVNEIERPKAKHPSPVPSPARNPKAKSLRLSSGVKRGTLLCQSLPSQVYRAGSEARIAKRRKTSRSRSKESTLAASHSANGSSPKRPSTKDSVASHANTKRSRPEADKNVHNKRTRVPKPPSPVLMDVFENSDLVHGLMDQQLLVPSSPNPSLEVLPLAKVISTNRPQLSEAKQKADPVQHVSESAPVTDDPGEVTRVAESPKASSKLRRNRQNPSKPRKADAAIVPHPAPVLAPPAPLLRDVSPVWSDISDSRPHTRSVSPEKFAISTGGFRKKPKRVTKDFIPSTNADTTPPPPPPRNETVALPPHPLRAGEKGPLMSTTELAALLQKPSKKQKTAKDPIEDDIPPTGKSPNRSFRRVRSENDAPIPSTAEDWENRNLPKTSSTLTDVTEPGIEPPPIVVTAQEPPRKKDSFLKALIKKTDPRRKLQRAQSLNVDTTLQTIIEAAPVSPVVDKDIGPWSTEAFDLFDWRPPGRENVGTAVND